MTSMISQQNKDEEITFINNVGYRIQYLRKQQGLSQAQLAEKSGLSTHTINVIEQRNQRGLSMITLYRIAKGLDVHPSSLFDFKWSRQVNCRTPKQPGGG